MAQWISRVAPALGPDAPTLSSSYIARDRDIFEIETLIGDGLSHLRRDHGDPDGAVLVGEALRRVLSIRRAQRRLAEISRPDRLTRVVARFKGPNERERHLGELADMAIGVLMHYGRRDLIDRAAKRAENPDVFPDAVVTTAVRVRREQAERTGTADSSQGSA